MTAASPEPEGPHPTGQAQAATAALEALVSGIGSGFLLLVDERLRIVRAGAMAARLAERPTPTLDGMSIIAAFGSVALDAVAREAAEQGTHREREVRLGHRAGQIFQVDAMPLHEHGIVLFLHDVTGVRRIERMRRDFIANISHELRTPLTSIKLIAETLAGGAVEDVETARDFAGQIEREVDQLAQLVDELLELSMIESGEVKLQIEPISSAMVVAAVVTRMSPMAERSRMRLDAAAPPDPARVPFVAADANRLEQAIVNLVHNAIKFSHPNGQVTVSWESRDSHVRFLVRDDGIGISETHQARIFERFYKVNRSRTREPRTEDQDLRTGSAGLGLAIVRHIAEAHGGSVGVESHEGKGSTFWIDIPVAGAGAATLSTPVGTTPPPGNRSSATGTEGAFS